MNLRGNDEKYQEIYNDLKEKYGQMFIRQKAPTDRTAASGNLWC